MSSTLIRIHHHKIIDKQSNISPLRICMTTLDCCLDNMKGRTRINCFVCSSLLKSFLLANESFLLSIPILLLIYKVHNTKKVRFTSLKHLRTHIPLPRNKSKPPIAIRCHLQTTTTRCITPCHRNHPTHAHVWNKQGQTVK